MDVYVTSQHRIETVWRVRVVNSIGRELMYFLIFDLRSLSAVHCASRFNIAPVYSKRAPGLVQYLEVASITITSLTSGAMNMSHVLLSICTMASVASLISAARILLIPTTHRSHVNLFAITGKTLQDRGHDVHVLVLESRQAQVDRVQLSVIPFPEVQGAEMVQSEDMMLNFLNSQGHILETMKLLYNIGLSVNILCEGIHENTKLMANLGKLKFDLVIIDGIYYTRCMYSVPYRLGVPYITLTTRPDPLNAGVPEFLFVEPIMGVGNLNTSDTLILERIKNLLAYVVVWAMMPPPGLDESIITRYCTNRPPATFHELFRKSEMWLVKLETTCLDTPRVYGSHYQYVGGIGLEKANPLPPDLEEFVQKSPAGFIVLTFGSGLRNIPSNMLTKMLHAFAQVDFHVIMRHAGDVLEKVPGNVKMMSWIPQSDLLGHPKARAFITHGGANGQLEGLHHGVPMITIPMLGDQMYNAQRVERKGFGVTLDRHSFTAEDLLDAVQKVAGGEDYREMFGSLPQLALPTGHHCILGRSRSTIRRRPFEADVVGYPDMEDVHARCINWLHCPYHCLVYDSFGCLYQNSTQGVTKAIFLKKR